MLQAEARAAATPIERPRAAVDRSRIDAAGRLEPGSLDALLDQAVARFPTQRFLEFQGKVWTFEQVGHLVERAAAGFQKLGVGPGVKVGLFLPNCPYFVIGFFAVLKAGGTVVSYNPLYADREIEHQIDNSETEIIVTLDLAALLPKLQPMLGRTRLRAIVVARFADLLPFPKSFLFPWLKRREMADVPDQRGYVWFNDLLADHVPAHRPAPDRTAEIAVLQYTGGTTGVAKGAVLTHANLLANAAQLAGWYREARPGGERVLAVLPLFHVFALTVAMLYSVRMGAELILVPRFDLTQLLGTITRKRPTILPGVPTLFAAINNHPALARYDLSSIRLCISGGAPLPREVQDTFEARTGCQMVEGYGLTESLIVSCNPIGGPRKAGSIGLPLPGTIIEIVSPADRTTVLPSGETGEICVRGPQRMAGYWNRPDETAKVLVDDRLHTGDLGYLDEDGYGFVVDRLKELILCSGFNVYPRVVEEAIYRHPVVLEAAVVGVPDDYRGETVKAYVVPSAGNSLTASELLAFLKDQLSPIEMPKLIEFRSALPKSTIGKILKRELRRQHLEGTGQA
ncbi:MAG: long-chain-fatty-acid--CoA ligase [Geminicoccaceae bacterium]